MSDGFLTGFSPPPLTWQAAHLHFVPPDGYLNAVEQLFQEGARTFLIRPYAPSLAAPLQARFGNRIHLAREATDLPSVDAILLPPMNGEQLSSELHHYIDRPVRLIAPITTDYIVNRSLFVVTIPKAGTHFLFHLLDSFGVRPGGHYQARIAPNHYYFLFHEHSHLPADQFVEMLAHTPRGGASHPFVTTPTLFIYRNPLDILVSEVFYYVRRENTALASFYEDSSPAERALQLIHGFPLLPSLRERVGRYAPWLKLKNMLPLCYEEVVGARGGGSEQAQARAVWSLQLKLHVPGSPLTHARRSYSEQSHTFRKGHINDHRSFFTPEHYAAFRSLPQDFMHAFGYDIEDRFTDGYLPRFVDMYRHRPLFQTGPGTKGERSKDDRAA